MSETRRTFHDELDGSAARDPARWGSWLGRPCRRRCTPASHATRPGPAGDRHRRLDRPAVPRHRTADVADARAPDSRRRRSSPDLGDPPLSLHLERIGDQAVNIAKLYLIGDLAGERHDAGAHPEMGDLVGRCFARRMEAFASGTSSSPAAPQMDDPVDRLNRGMYREVAQARGRPGRAGVGPPHERRRGHSSGSATTPSTSANRSSFLLTGEFREFTDASPRGARRDRSRSAGSSW